MALLGCILAGRTAFGKGDNAMENFGKLRKSEDDRTDPSGFLSKAREHQSKFRLEKLHLADSGEYGNYLTENDANKGFNFYDGFGIFAEVKKHATFNENLYQNMLRSEHIPFNMFIPLNSDKTYFKDVLNSILDDTVKSVDLLKIEYAPQPKESYLNDRTSFDAYIEYTQIDGNKGIIGIEVKYTEREYPIGSKEKNEVENPESVYYSVTKNSNTYKDESITKLREDNYRQIWRNHLLGESILLHDKDKFKHFTLITLFPQGNEHFQKVSKEYAGFLKENIKNKCLFITFEKLFGLLSKHCPNEEYKKWVDYLGLRYIL
jgi:hypothetical protein